jgi:surface antigen
MRMFTIAARTAILTAAAAGVCALSNIAQAATPTTTSTAATTSIAASSIAAAVPASARTAAHDLPDTAVRDDYNWRAYATTYLHGDTYSARQCTAFALWRIDNRTHQTTNTTLYRLARAYRMTGAKDLDNAATRAGYNVDRTPAVGSLATWEAGVAGASKYGHVAYVARLYADHTILIEEYNGTHALAYGTRRIPANTVSHYLHLTHR